ncbi:MAG: 7-cyano-7-deazaguanine synthase [Candidatus Omnitrophota bacterium]|nr:MAG: 7-cyano-7-deazaguanine synthase [Candidatus Omnitrophota bacterium]
MKALALLSGGLDSSLAIRLIQNQGIEVVGLHFLIPFCRHKDVKMEKSAAKKIADSLRVKLKTEYLGQEFLKMVKNPRYGYGKNLNPCIDCKILMFKKAKKIMKEVDASFIVSGEVLGQRPMSQNKQSLKLIEKESGLKGLLLRPLSAKLLSLTIAEEKGWVKREGLEDVCGRGRNLQIKLAEKLGIREYPWPAGGCLLTDPEFCKRLKDLIKHNQFALENIELLKVGRHFRFSPTFKLVVGRDKEENERLNHLFRKGDIYFEPKEEPGPSALGRGEYDEETKLLAARIIARYTSCGQEVKIFVRILGKTQEEYLVKGSDKDIRGKMIR